MILLDPMVLVSMMKEFFVFFDGRERERKGGREKGREGERKREHGYKCV